MINVTLAQFKRGIAKHAAVLRLHGLIDPAEREKSGYRGSVSRKENILSVIQQEDL